MKKTTTLQQEKEIIKLYNSGESGLTIAKKYNFNNNGIVYHILKKNNIKARDNKEKTLNAIKQGRSSNSELQRKITSERWKGKNNPRWKLGRSKCEICGNEGHGGKREYGKMLCKKHYLQMYRHGKIFERTRFDRHNFIDKGKYYELDLYNCKQEVIGKFKIDKEDLEKVMKCKWCINSNGYIYTSIKRKHTPLHQFILGKKEGLDIDHENHDKKDNRKQNLRYATRSQNLMNKQNVLGITWDKSRNKWQAQIVANGKHIFLGRYKDRDDALKARREGELKYFGEFAPKK